MEEPLDVRDTASADADAAHAHCDMAAPVTAVLQAAAALPHPQQLAQRAQTQARLWAGAFTFTLELGRYEVCACVQRGGGVYCSFLSPTSLFLIASRSPCTCSDRETVDGERMN